MTNNGKKKPTNGKFKRRKKNGRPKAGKGISIKMLKAVAIKHDGNATAIAKELGVAQQTISKHLKKIELRQAIEVSREEALRIARITQKELYKVVGKNLHKPRGPDMRHAIDKSMILLGEDSGEKGGPTVIVKMPVVIVDGKPFHPKIAEIIDVDAN